MTYAADDVSVTHRNTLCPFAGIAIDMATPMELAAALFHSPDFVTSMATVTTQVGARACVVAGGVGVAISPSGALNINARVHVAVSWRTLEKNETLLRKILLRSAGSLYRIFLDDLVAAKTTPR